MIRKIKKQRLTSLCLCLCMFFEFFLFPWSGRAFAATRDMQTLTVHAGESYRISASADTRLSWTGDASFESAKIQPWGGSNILNRINKGYSMWTGLDAEGFYDVTVKKGNITFEIDEHMSVSKINHDAVVKILLKEGQSCRFDNKTNNSYKVYYNQYNSKIRRRYYHINGNLSADYTDSEPDISFGSWTSVGGGYTYANTKLVVDNLEGTTVLYLAYEDYICNSVSATADMIQEAEIVYDAYSISPTVVNLKYGETCQLKWSSNIEGYKPELSFTPASSMHYTVTKDGLITAKSNEVGKIRISDKSGCYKECLINTGQTEQVTPQPTTVTTKPSSDVELERGADFVLGTNKSTSLNGDVAKFFPTNYSLSLAEFPVTISKKTDKKTGTYKLKIAIGAENADWLGEKSSWDKYKQNVEDANKYLGKLDALKSYKENWNLKKVSLFNAKKFEKKPSLSVMGYLEQTYDKNNMLVASTGKIATDFKWSGSAKWQFLTAAGPFYITLSGKGILSGEFGIKYDYKKKKWAFPDGSLTITPQISFEGGYGIQKFATVGGVGSLSSPVQLLPTGKWSIEAEAGLHIYVFFLIDETYFLPKWKSGNISTWKYQSLTSPVYIDLSRIKKKESVSITIFDEKQSDISENTVTDTIGLTDISINNVSVVEKSKNVTIAVTLENESRIKGNASLSIYQDDNKTEELGNSELIALNPGEHKEISLTVPETGIVYNENDSAYLFLQATVQDGDYNKENNQDYAIVYKTSTITPGNELSSVDKNTLIGIPTGLRIRNKKKKSAILSWKKVKHAKGYQLQYSTNKMFKKAKKKFVKKTTITIKKLKKKKRYFFRVRAYRKNAGKKIYGKWSKCKKIKIKK